ncbi:MAG: carboxypeptidase-like regulatory domain-containing protein [Bacteroidia bacterium]|nr:carboxypeptidase-like regulatory domain-containing protein [Bacteroidia bacterium]MDW8016164.1 carboxypeptidase-like regulatory domain-containing protein [Bacteroidia bacterium]
MRLAFILLLGALIAQEERVLSPSPVVSKGSDVSMLRGRIIDARTGEPLVGVQIRLGLRGVYTDDKGNFVIPFEKSDTLSAFLLGYRVQKVIISQPSSDIILRMEPLETEIGEVQIIDDVSRETEAGNFLERLRSLEMGELYSQELIMKRSTDFYIPNVLR